MLLSRLEPCIIRQSLNNAFIVEKMVDERMVFLSNRQGRRNVFEHGEDRSFWNGPSSSFQPPCFPMQFNIMHVCYSKYSKPQENQVTMYNYFRYLAIPFLGASFAPENN